MDRKIAEAIKNKDLELVAVDKETAQKIKNICDSSGANAKDIVNAAIQVLEKSLGREVTVKASNSPWKLRINHFRKFKKVTDILPK